MSRAAWIALAFCLLFLVLAATRALGQSTSSASEAPTPQPVIVTDPAYGSVENVSARTTARTAHIAWDVADPCGPDIVSRLTYWLVEEPDTVLWIEQAGAGHHELSLARLHPDSEYAYSIDLRANCGIGGGSSGELRFLTKANPVWVPALAAGSLLVVLGAAAWDLRRRL